MSPQDEQIDSSVIDLRRRRVTEERSQDIEAEPEDIEDSDKTLFSWQAPEFEKHEKGEGWYLIFGTVMVILVVVSLIAKAILPAITFILLGAVLFIFSKKSPREILFAIRKDGVLIDKKLYEWENLASFWIFYKPRDIKVLSLRSKKPLMPYIYIPIGKENPIQLRRLISKYIPEEEQEESVIDQMARRIGF